MVMQSEPIPEPLEIAIDGKTYTGTYMTDGRTVTVRYALSTRRKIVANVGAPAVALARSLLSEMVREDKQRRRANSLSASPGHSGAKAR
jgi:hypothetical protein